MAFCYNAFHSARFRVWIILVSLTAIFPATLFAFSGTEGASFLELPVGARPAALGSAYSMLAEDAYAPTWNPAGLAFLDDSQVAGMHQAYLYPSSYEYGSFVHPFGRGRGIGASIQYFRPGTLEGLDESGNSIGEGIGKIKHMSREDFITDSRDLSVS